MTFKYIRSRQNPIPAPTGMPIPSPTVNPSPSPTPQPTIAAFTPTDAPTPFDCPDLCISQPCQYCDEVEGCEWYHFKTGCVQCDISGGYFKVKANGADICNYACVQCQEIFGDECLQCHDGIGCSQCESGYELTYYSECGLKYCEPIIDPPTPNPTSRPTNVPVIGGGYGQCPDLCNPLGDACDCINQVSNCIVCNQGSGCAQCDYGYFKPGYNGEYNCLSCTQFAGAECQFCQDGQGCGQCVPGYHPEAISSCGLKVCVLN